MCRTELQFIEYAEEYEHERIPFWLQYHPDYIDACKAVAENPPSFDQAWQRQFPDPKAFCEFIEQERKFKEG